MDLSFLTMGEAAREDRREFVNDDANTNTPSSIPCNPDSEPSFSPLFDYTGTANESMPLVLMKATTSQWTFPYSMQLRIKLKIQARKAMQSYLPLQSLILL